MQMLWNHCHMYHLGNYDRRKSICIQIRDNHLSPTYVVAEEDVGRTRLSLCQQKMEDPWDSGRLWPFPGVCTSLYMCIQHSAWYVANSRFVFWNTMHFMPLTHFHPGLVESSKAEQTGRELQHFLQWPKQAQIWGPVSSCLPSKMIFTVQLQWST
jgi:hypothetical protein